MSVTPLLSSDSTLERLDTILSETTVSLELTFLGKGYLRIGQVRWIYLQNLTYLVLSILLNNPHFSETERAAAIRLSERIKAYYSIVSESQERISRIAKAIGLCCHVENPLCMKSFIEAEIDILTRLYTEKQWATKFPDRPLGGRFSDIGHNFQVLYSPPSSSNGDEAFRS